MLARLRDYHDPALDRELQDRAVYSVDGEKLGSIDDALVDRDSSELRYLVVDAGWLSSRRFLVPAEQAFGSPNGDDLRIGLAKQDVERLPEFREEFLDSPDQFAKYEQRYRGAWQYDRQAAPGRPCNWLERLRASLRGRPAKRGLQRQEELPPESAQPFTAAHGATALYGVYSNQADLERAVSELKDLGFANTEISVVFPDREKTRNFALQKATKAPEGALAGGGTGLVVGGVLGWLAGIGALAIPGVGPIIAAGPIVAAITGAGVGSAVGGIAGALIGLGVPEVEAKRYESELKKGGMLLSVRCADPRFAESARKVLQRTHAKDMFFADERRAA